MNQVGSNMHRHLRATSGIGRDVKLTIHGGDVLAVADLEQTESLDTSMRKEYELMLQILGARKRVQHCAGDHNTQSFFGNNVRFSVER